MVTGLSVQFYAHTLPVAHVVEKSLLHGVVDNGGVIIRRAVVALTDIVVELLGIRVKPIDRKSTRLNSSHVSISYAVFCLKKKSLNDQTERVRDDHGRSVGRGGLDDPCLH